MEKIIDAKVSTLERLAEMENKLAAMQHNYDEIERKYHQMEQAHGQMQRDCDEIVQTHHAMNEELATWQSRWSMISNLRSLTTTTFQDNFERVVRFSHNISRTVLGLVNESGLMRDRMDFHLNNAGWGPGTIQEDRQRFGHTFIPAFDFDAWEGDEDILSQDAAFTTPPRSLPPRNAPPPTRGRRTQQTGQHSQHAPQRVLTFDEFCALLNDGSVGL